MVLTLHECDLLSIFKRVPVSAEWKWWSIVEIRNELRPILAKRAKEKRSVWFTHCYSYFPYLRDLFDDVPTENALRLELNALCFYDILLISEDFSSYGITMKGRKKRFTKPRNILNDHAHPVGTPPTAA
jgi:hypothetical protein